MSTKIQLEYDDEDEELAFVGAPLPPKVARRTWPERGRPLVLPVVCVIGGILIGQLLGPYLHPPVSDAALLREATPGRDLNAILASTSELPEATANNLRLTNQECEIGFPLLWPEVEKTRRQFTGSRGITLDDVKTVEVYNGTRVAIIDNRVYIKRFHTGGKSRNQAVLASLYEAVSTSPEPIKDVEFWFSATDSMDEGARFGLNKGVGERMWLLPDFGFWSWPEPRVNGWSDYRRRAMSVDSRMPWHLKFDKLFWRGNLLSDFRKELYELAKGFEWNDVKALKWRTLEGRIEMEDHCKHRYLASIEGKSAYSGRLKYILQCRSVTVSHKMKWMQHFHPALNSDPESMDQNIVELKTEGWGELPGVMAALIKDPARSQRIADNAVRTMRGRYLTPASVTCYWRRVLDSYASVQHFLPTIGSGIDYQSFSLLERIEWTPY